MNSIQKIDLALQIFVKEKEKQEDMSEAGINLTYNDIFIRAKFQIMERELRIILQKLHKDGYILAFVGFSEFTVTYDGLLFYYGKGYSGQIRKHKAQALKDWLLIFGSILAGVGTILLFLKEMGIIHS